MPTSYRLRRLLLGLILVVSLMAGCSQPTPAAPQAAAPAQSPSVGSCQVNPVDEAQVDAPVLAADLQTAVAQSIRTLPEGYNGIAPAKLQEQLAAGPVFILDVREPQDLAATGFINGAVNIPMRQVLNNLDKLPAQDQPIVVYCGIGHRGGIMMETLSLLGYTNVKSLSRGLTGWKEANLPLATGTPAEATAGQAPAVDANRLAALATYIDTLPAGYGMLAPAKLHDQMTEASPFILDVREAIEFDMVGRLAGAVNVPLRTLFDSMDKLPQAKDTPILVYCSIGHRGAVAMVALHLAGYTNVQSLSGGFNAWKEAGLPISKS